MKTLLSFGCLGAVLSAKLLIIVTVLNPLRKLELKIKKLTAVAHLSLSLFAFPYPKPLKISGERYSSYCTCGETTVIMCPLQVYYMCPFYFCQVIETTKRHDPQDMNTRYSKS